MDPQIPNLTVALFGNSASIHFAHDNLLVGEKTAHLENVERSRIHSVQTLQHVSVINMMDLHETEVHLDSVNHLIGQLVHENEICAFIFVIRLDQLTYPDKTGLEWLQKVFGDRVLQFVMILFTYERDEDRDTIIDDLKKNTVVKQLVLKCGRRYHICSKTMNNRSEMTDLMRKIERQFNENKHQCYTKDMYNTQLQERRDQNKKNKPTNSKERMPYTTAETQEKHRGENKDIKTAQVRPDQPPQQEMTRNEKLRHLFNRLHLSLRYQSLRTADVLQISSHSLQSHESCAEDELVNIYLQKLLMMNYRARYITTKETNEEHHTQQTDKQLMKHKTFLEAMSSANTVTSTPDPIHPMDVQMAVFHCADSFLKQMMVTKLSQCQFALPLLVPHPFTEHIEFPLWTFRQINKSWKIRKTDNDIISKVQPVCTAETPMVSFFRFGSVSSSKSHLMNSLINEKHNTFFTRNCPGSSRTRLLMDGVVEIAWYCPSGKHTDTFTDCVAFCNLHGDAGDNETQMKILTEMSSVNVVFLSELDENNKNLIKLENLYGAPKPLICIFPEDKSTSTEKDTGKYKIGLKDRNQADVSKDLRRAINDCISSSASASVFRLEDVSKHSDIRVDEEDDEDCRRGGEAAQEMMSLLKNKPLAEIKESFLPCQGKLWLQWCKKNKQLHRPKGEELEQEIIRIKNEMKKIRENQHKSHMSEFTEIFIKQMNSNNANKIFFLKWLRILLNEFTSVELSNLHHEYNEKWSKVLQLKKSHDKSVQLKREQTELELKESQDKSVQLKTEQTESELNESHDKSVQLKREQTELELKESQDKSVQLKTEQTESELNESHDKSVQLKREQTELELKEGQDKSVQLKTEQTESELNESHDKSVQLKREQTELELKESQDKSVQLKTEQTELEQNENQDKSVQLKTEQTESELNESHDKSVQLKSEQTKLELNESQHKSSQLKREQTELELKESQDKSVQLKREQTELELKESQDKSVQLKTEQTELELNESPDKSVQLKTEQTKLELNESPDKSSQLKREQTELELKESQDKSVQLKREQTELELKESQDKSVQLKTEQTELELNESPDKSVQLKTEQTELELKESQDKSVQLKREQTELELKESQDKSVQLKTEQTKLELNESPDKSSQLKREQTELELNESPDKSVQLKREQTELELKESHDKSVQLKTEQTELERISADHQAAAFGLEHIMREIGQIYESYSSVKKNKTDLQFDFSSLPSLAAEMMISGFPLELMDGDAAHVPVMWVTAVLDILNQKLGDQRVFVMSVLGIQSSGKSTMLNAMFGLEFAVSAGRCTRGAFMQLIRVSEEMKNQMKFDYILVVDTEGLRALELAVKSTRHHDNELATFVIGLGHLTLINIFGENPSEMQDILQIVVQAFMRMKKVKLSPSCMFVHQNVSDITAGEKNMDGRRKLQKKLDEMTKLAAKDEGCVEECFSDVIKFDVHHDVKYFGQLWEGSPPMAPPNPNYCENIEELKKTIISCGSKSDGVKLTHLRDRIQDLWEALLNERFVFSFRNAVEISAYRRLETEYSKWTWSLRSAMLEIENKVHNQILNVAIHEIEETDLHRELKQKSDEVTKSKSELFEKDADKDILIQWKVSFEIKIKEFQENIVRETKRKINEVLQQRDLKRKLDAQKTLHENTLLEKSKELALKHKDKANDEETLKREFDLFWEECVKKITTDSPPIKDIDILRDVKNLLSGYESVHTCENFRNIFNMLSFSDYVQFKRSTGFTGHVKEKFGSLLSIEDETQIRSLISDVTQQTDNTIVSFNISKMGYNISYIQQLTDNIKATITEYEERHVKYVFKNEFFMDLVFSIFKRANQTFTDQHRMFREANDPDLYLKKKKDEYYSIFQKYCHGATSAAIFGEIICQKLKEPIEQSVYKQTAINLADEMRSNCPSLNGNKSNLEKHILKRLAEDENFDKYTNYIKNPKDHFKSFIRDEVSQYIRDQFSVSVQLKMNQNIELLQKKIMTAAHESTQHVQENRGNVDLWLKFFTLKLSDVLMFSVKDFSGVKHDDVDDFKLLEDVISKELDPVMSDIIKEFSRDSFDKKLCVSNRTDEILIDQFCQCCWVQCPFCTAICTNTIPNHDGDHSVPFHQVRAVNGTQNRGTKHFALHICTTAVASSDLSFHPDESDRSVLYREYRTAGKYFAKWSITPDLSELPYWKWFVCRFEVDLEKYYNLTFQGSGKIPDEWKQITKQEATESLDEYI